MNEDDQMKYYPKISIITISYNSEKTIERTIKSVIDQHYDKLEYIIVDGGSKDSTVDIIKKYDQYISKWISEKDHGISDAFNKGIKMASGEIIGIINSDDGYLPNAFNKLARHYDSKVDVYKGNIIFWNEKTGKRIREKPSKKMRYSGIGLRLCHQGTFVRKDAYERFGVFDEKLRYNMDLDLLFRFERNGAQFKFVDEDLAYFTMEGVTFEQTTEKQMDEMKAIIVKNGGNAFDILTYSVVKRIKMFIKETVGIDRVLYFKNLRTNVKREQ